MSRPRLVSRHAMTAAAVLEAGQRIFGENNG